ncbi:hypothetical protein [Haliangium sp.]|uniref:hypothetical protein n=1 Tax=Haliangium sp. TaxID=2663208 RepID=UPI003D0EA548
MTRRLLSFSFTFLLALALAGCASLLGIDDVSEGGGPDAAPAPDALAMADARGPIADATPPRPDAAPADAFIQPACTPDQPPFDGVLCGPGAHPCQIQDDAIIDDPHFRNGAPAVAVDGQCQPQISFSVAESGFHGFFAVPDAGGNWGASETPFALARVAAVSSPDGTPSLLSSEGSFVVALHSLDRDGTWSTIQVPDETVLVAGSLARESNGEMHAAMRLRGDEVVYGRFTGNWFLTPIGENAALPVRLAMIDNGPPQFAWWNSDGGEWRLRWKAQPGVIETASNLGSNSLGSESQRFSIAVSGPDAQNPGGRPHIVYPRPRLNNFRVLDLVYATRSGANNWDAVIITSDERAGANYCETQPQVSGETCELSHDTLSPIGIVATPSGSVRVLYAVHHREATLTADCDLMPGFCFYQTTEDRTTAELMIATVDDQLQSDVVSVGEVFQVVGATVVLDTVGSMHIAMYGRDVGDSGTTVRYMRVGP